MKNHLLQCNAKDVAQFSNPVGFVDAMLGDINGCRATHATENSGISVSRIALIFFRLAKSGSHFSFSSKGACCPNAENVIWLPRSSIISPQTFSALKSAASIACFRELMIFSFSPR